MDDCASFERDLHFYRDAPSAWSVYKLDRFGDKVAAFNPDAGFYA